jgi:hypothetical protein
MYIQSMGSNHADAAFLKLFISQHQGIPVHVVRPHHVIRYLIKEKGYVRLLFN